MTINDAKRHEKIRLALHGRVQGVGFRWFVVTEAERLGLVGWVLNRPDGTVELEAEGEASALAVFRERVAHGPPAARVERVDELPGSLDALPRNFEIR